MGGGQELFGLLSPWDPLHTHMLHLLWIGLVNISSAISIRLSLAPWVCGFEVASLAGSMGLPSSSSSIALSGFVLS